MSGLVATIIDFDALWETIVAALVAGVGVTLAFSLAIYGVARFVDAQHDGRAGAATWFAAVATFGFAATAAGVAAGLVVMITG